MKQLIIALLLAAAPMASVGADAHTSASSALASCVTSRVTKVSPTSPASALKSRVASYCWQECQWDGHSTSCHQRCS